MADKNDQMFIPQKDMLIYEFYEKKIIWCNESISGIVRAFSAYEPVHGNLQTSAELHVIFTLVSRLKNC